MPPPKFSLEEALSLRAQGLSYAKIAARLGVHPSAVHQRLAALSESWRLRRNERQVARYRRGTKIKRMYRCSQCDGLKHNRRSHSLESRVHSPVLP